jgi:hypothetical protein
MAAVNPLPPRCISASPVPIFAVPIRTEAPHVGAVTVSRIPAARGMPEGLELVCTAPELRRVVELRAHVYPDGFARGAWMSATLWLEGGCSCLVSTRAHPFAPRADRHHWRLRPVFLPALVLGDVSLSLTEGESRELRAHLEPLGLEVIGAAPALEGMRS